MIDSATGELSFNEGTLRVGPSTTPQALSELPIAAIDACGPDLVSFMTTKEFCGLRSGAGLFTARLDFLRSELTSVRLSAQGGEFPPDLDDWSLAREEARHDFHCLWIRGQLGWLWRLRRYPWGRVQALCGRNLDMKPRESVIKIVYVEFAAIEEEIAREFTT